MCEMLKRKKYIQHIFGTLNLHLRKFYFLFVLEKKDPPFNLQGDSCVWTLAEQLCLFIYSSQLNHNKWHLYKKGNTEAWEI